ncbi:MAG: ABC transporter permease [Chloroflexi bacterium]|nr:ABC transporter permease [Chloroflexota bacterium]
MRLVREKPLGVVGAVIVLVMALLALFANWVSPFGYHETHYSDALVGPNSTYLLGTDYLGRDQLSRIIYGARISMVVALAAVSLGTIYEVLIGLPSAYFGGKLDAIVQRFVDAFMAFPALLIMLVVSSILGPGLLNIIVVLSIFGVSSSRVIRGAALAVKENVYVEAAKALGCSHLRIMLRYILPNVMAPIIIVATLRFGQVILTESTLSFLGYGIPPPFPSWGRMLSEESRLYMYRAPWLAIWPGVALTSAVWGFNVFGDAIRDLLDPRMRGGGAGRFR